MYCHDYPVISISFFPSFFLHFYKMGDYTDIQDILPRTKIKLGLGQKLETGTPAEIRSLSFSIFLLPWFRLSLLLWSMWWKPGWLALRFAITSRHYSRSVFSTPCEENLSFLDKWISPMSKFECLHLPLLIACFLHQCSLEREEMQTGASVS